MTLIAVALDSSPLSLVTQKAGKSLMGTNSYRPPENLARVAVFTFSIIALLPYAARADSYTSPGPTGGTVVDGASSFPYTSLSGGYGGFTSGSNYNAQCSGAITTKFTWSGPTRAPDSVIIVETGYAYCAANSFNYPTSQPNAACSNGIGTPGSITTFSTYPGDEGEHGSVTDTRYTLNQGPTITLTCTPSASASVSNPGAAIRHSIADANQAVNATAKVLYSAAAYPITIQLAGTMLDSDSIAEIIVGQHCTASLQGIPPGCTVSNWKWAVTGTTFQTWSPTTPAIGIAPANPNASYEMGGPGPTDQPMAAWYWDDPMAATETVTCTATVIPPAGQGKPLSVTAFQYVRVKVPH